MGSPMFFRRSLPAFAVLGVLFGLVPYPAWALGPGAPPLVKSVDMMVTTTDDSAPQLWAELEIEIPGGNVPLNVAGVTVTLPAFDGRTFVIPFDRQDLYPNRGYFLSLGPASGFAGGVFPAGTYTFTVTDTAGGITVVSDNLGATTGLAAAGSLAISGTVPVSGQPGQPSTVLLNLAMNPTPTVNWTPPAGALNQRVRVRGGLQDLDLFSQYTSDAITTSMALPAGIMVPGRRYLLRVEAFDHADPWGCSATPPCTNANARSRRRLEIITQGPEIFLTFPAATPYAAGNSLDVTARIYNTGPAIKVNATAWIGLPTGAVIPILNLANLTIHNSTANPAGPNNFYEGPIGFGYTFNGSEPGGNYVVGLRLTDPDTGDTVALATRTFFVGDSIIVGDPTFIQPRAPRKSQKAGYASPQPGRGSSGLIAALTVPYKDALVRGTIPVFGVAAGENFMRYRVEYAEGPEPTKWITIVESNTPETWEGSPADLDTSADSTIHGNLATWDTGLKSYVYLPSYPEDHPIDLKGVYTLRLVVTGHDGGTVEDRVTVEVGDVIPNAWGGAAISADRRVGLRIPEQALMDSFRLISIKPAGRVPGPLPPGRRPVGTIYEFREPGEAFTKEAVLEMQYPLEEVGASPADKLGIYSYNARKGAWEHLRSVRTRVGQKIVAKVTELHPYYALMLSEVPGEGSTLEAKAEPDDGAVPSETDGGLFLVRDTFEHGTGEWSDRDGDAGGVVTLDDTASLDGTRCLRISKASGHGHSGVNVRRTPFDAREYPIVQFDYRIPGGVKTNFLAKVSGRWYEIGFTDDPKELRNKRVNIASIGRIEGVVADDQWHTARFNLYDMLRTMTGQTRVDELIMADWDVGGYMKLEFGKNPKGATYYIDNFSIARDPSPRLRVDGDAIVVDAFDRGQETNPRGEAGILFADNLGSQIQASFSDAPDAAGGGHALALAYDVSRVGGYAGYVMELRNLDLRGYHTLTFSVKGSERGQDMLVGLKDRVGREHKVLLSPYLEGGLTTTWQQVTIPLAAFSRDLDWAALANLSFSLEHALHPKGTVLVDTIEFHRRPRSLLVNDFEREGDRNLMGGTQWTFAVGEARIEEQRAKNSPNGVMRLSYASELWSYAGWATQLGGLDCSRCGALSFRIRGADGGETPHVYLDDGNFRWGVDLEKYGPLTREWKTVTIPLRDFAEYGVDLTHLAELQVVFEWEKAAGTISLDDIRFGSLVP